MLRDQTVQGLWSVGGQVPLERAVEVSNVRAAIDEERAVVLGMDVDVDLREVGREFAHDLFEDILERDQPLDIAVFVDHETDPALLVLKIEQLLVQRRALGHEVRLAREAEQGVLVGKVDIEGGGRHPGATRNASHRGHAEAVLGDLDQGRLEQCHPLGVVAWAHDIYPLVRCLLK